ncbi:MAG: hypothetical protein QW568_04605 [Candidatus Anstonellaceae archaeon]
MILSVSLFALLLLFSAAQAYHHPGDMVQQPSKPADPIWNFVGLGIIAVLAYCGWKVYEYQKKFRA